MNTFCVEIDENTNMDELNNFMDEYYKLLIKEIEDLAKELNVSEHCANDIFYLRSRSRWTQELEDLLIELHKNNTPPKNMMDWP